MAKSLPKLFKIMLGGLGCTFPRSDFLIAVAGKEREEEALEEALKTILRYIVKAILPGRKGGITSLLYSSRGTEVIVARGTVDTRGEYWLNPSTLRGVHNLDDEDIRKLEKLESGVIILKKDIGIGHEALQEVSVGGEK